MDSEQRPNRNRSALEDLRDALRQFAQDRDWDQFHSPKNLATALVVEASELLEHFQWLRCGNKDEIDEKKLREIEEELADVLLYLVRLADKLGIDLIIAADNKLEKNGSKYPVEKAKGNSKKYTEL